MATTSPSTKAPADSTTAPAAPTDSKVHAASAAFNHFSQGKRHLLVGDFKSAVSAFKEATVALVDLYGEQAPECGDAYYHYGRALLELARKEAGVLGPDLDGASSQEGSTGEEEDEEEESEESQEEEEGGKKEEEEDQDSEEKEKSKKEENAEEGEGENTEEEEVTTLQCAWEWLDVARVIFDKQEEKPEVAKKRAQIRLSLGEVCMENEDYEGAISEFKNCLSMQEKVLTKDDRSLAETHYQLGLVYSLADDFDNAVAHYTAAVDVIQLKIKNLKARVEEKNSWSKERRDKDLAESKDVFYTEEGEIEDLQQLLPDIQLKIVDMKEMKASSMERLQQAAKAMLLGRGEGPGASGAVFSQARDSEAGASTVSKKFSETKPILCQVRRKQRKPEDSEAADEQKKPRLENGAKSDGPEAEDKTKQSSNSLPKPIAVKRKVTHNEKDSSVESSVSAAESSSTKTESSSSAVESSSKTSECLSAPQEIK